MSAEMSLCCSVNGWLYVFIVIFFSANADAQKGSDADAQKGSDAATFGATLVPIGMLAVSFAVGCCVIFGAGKRR